MTHLHPATLEPVSVTPKTEAEIRTERRRTPAGCGILELAPLWPKRGENIGTLVRTADAIGGCLVVPHSAQKTVKSGNTIGLHNSPVHWIGDPMGWLAETQGTHYIIAVELAHYATKLADLRPVSMPTVVLLGNETHGIPKEAWRWVDQAVEIPMSGVGNSLNVAVTGSLVAYKLAGLS